MLRPKGFLPTIRGVRDRSNERNTAVQPTYGRHGVADHQLQHRDRKTILAESSRRLIDCNIHTNIERTRNGILSEQAALTRNPLLCQRLHFSIDASEFVRR